MSSMIHTSDNLFCSNLLPILELSVKFVSQICHENINKPLDGTYLADFGIDIREKLSSLELLSSLYCPTTRLISCCLHLKPLLLHLAMY